MKKIFYLILLTLSLSNRTHALDDLSAEHLFPNCPIGMKNVKFKLLLLLGSNNIEEAYKLLAVSNENTLKYFFDENPYISTIHTRDGKNLLHLACIEGDSELAHKLYLYDKNLLSEYDNTDKSPLYYALLYGYNNIVDSFDLDSHYDYVTLEEMNEINEIRENYFYNRDLDRLYNRIR